MLTAERYAEDVVAGRVVAGRWLRLAVQRHLRDLETASQRGLRFNVGDASRIIEFFSFLHHSKGEWAGREFTLEPWQQWLLWTLFGWQRRDPESGRWRRRFRTAYIEIARKNGKSTLVAGIGLYLLDADGEPGAEVYTAATKREQARIVHSEAIRMRDASPMLTARIQRYKDNLSVVGTASKYEPLGRDANTLDGLNVHAAIVDELHAHRNREMWDILDTATGARRQPMLLAITTAGYNRQTVCWEQHEYTEKIVSGVLEDDRHFGAIYAIDDGDDWTDESVWYKANPNLGVSKKLEDMRRKAERAKHVPAALNTFLRLELDVWTQASSRWISPEDWRACNQGVVAEPDLQGRRCWLGLDLSSTLDITALVAVFEPKQPGGVWDVVARFWVPGENVQKRVHEDRVPYDAWMRMGFIEPTQGNVVDYDWIEATLATMLTKWRVQEIAFDPWGATSVSNHMLDQNAPMVEFRQGYVSMNPAMKALEVAIQQRRINHQGNPVLTWMADNLVVAKDPAGNMKPDKGKSTERIDGMVALIMAYHRAMLNTKPKESVYAVRGIRSL